MGIDAVNLYHHRPPGFRHSRNSNKRKQDEEKILSESGYKKGRLLEEQLRPLENAADVNKVLTRLRRKGRLSHPEDVRTAIRCLGNKAFWQEAIQLLQTKLRAPYKPSPRMYSAAINVAQQWVVVLVLLEAAKQAGALDVQVLNSAMAMLNKAKLPELTAALFHEWKELPWNSCSFSTLIQSQRLAGNWLKAVQLLREMRDIFVMPDIISYNTAIWACAELSPNWNICLELLREVWLESLPCSMLTFTGAILACARAGKWQRALLLLADSRTQSLPPDVPSHASAIHACSEAAKWQQTLVLLSDMAGHKAWPDLVTFNSAIVSCARGQQWRWSLQLLSGMLLDEILPDVATYRAILEAYACSRKWKEALMAIEDLERFTESIDVEGRSSAMNCMGTCGQWAWAVQLMTDMSLQADSFAWNTCINACAAAGRWQQACLLHFDALEALECGAEFGDFYIAWPKAWQAALVLHDGTPARRLAPNLPSPKSAASKRP